MEETLALRLADARRTGMARYARVWLREVTGLLVLAISERLGRTRAHRRNAPVRASAGGGLGDALVWELRHAGRRLIRSPGFAVPAALMLSLAIGANASIFAVVESVVLRSLPYPESERLIELDHGAQAFNLRSGMGITPGLYQYYSDRARTLEAVAAYRTEELTLTGVGEPERIRVARATPSLGAVLRTAPSVGRWFRDQESLPGARAVAVLSHRLWVNRYGADPAILGRAVLLDGTPAEIIGVLPAAHAFPDARVDLWMAEPIARSAGFGLWTYQSIARLRDGATLADAIAELNGLIQDMPSAFPADPMAQGNAETKLVLTAMTLKEATTGGVARTLWVLLAAVGLVLMVACANVANLFLVRYEARQREVALRRALGADGGSIARFFLAESLLLSVVAGAIGVALAWMAVRLVVTQGPAMLPRRDEIALDAGVLAFTAALTLLSALGFGAIPLRRGRRLAESLREGGRTHTAGPNLDRARDLLMGWQIAMGLVLLVASSLMVRSFQKLRAVDPGFDSASALTFSVALPDRDYPTVQAVVGTHHAMLDRMAALPGVSAVSASTCLPLAGGCSGNTLRVFGREYPPGSLPPLALFRAVAGGYFEAMGMHVVRGRGIERGDVERSEPVAVVNQTLAEQFFPNQDAIGQRVASNRLGDLVWMTIVGVVANTPIRALGESDPLPQLYLPMSLSGGPGVPDSHLVGPDVSVMSYVVRSAAPPLALVSQVRRAIGDVDANVAIAQVRTLLDILEDASAQMAFTMVLLTIAASIALVLALIGIYGTVSYVVSHRTSEIGVRLALGAQPSGVVGMIVRQGGIIALAGIAIGIGMALAGSRFIEALLYDVNPRSPAVFASASLVLLATAVLACWLPARRASTINPISALTAE
jgi:predicted permease